MEYLATYSDARSRVRNRRICLGATPEAALAKARALNPGLPVEGFKVKRDWGFSYWRHGGYYTNVRHPSGACGCVARLDGGRWAIACDPRPDAERVTYRSRDDAAQAEADLIETRPDLYRPATITA